MSSPRRLAFIVVLILIAAGAGATPALAGEYPVYACEPAAGDVNNSWSSYTSTSSIAVYSNCPPGGNVSYWNGGLVTRAAMVPGSVPTHAHGRLTFQAPPGATLSRMTYAHHFCGGSSWLAGLMNASFTWLHSSSPGMCGTLVPSPYSISLGGTTAVNLVTWCVKPSCALGGTAPSGYAAMRSATVWVSDWTTPSVAFTGGDASAPGWKSGVVNLAFSANDNVGIKLAEVLRSGAAVWQQRSSCDHTSVVPCPSVAPNVALDTRGAPDGPQAFVVRVSDAADNLATRVLTVNADNTAPGPPVDLAVAGGKGWRSANSFALSWKNPPQPNVAPIAGADVAICPAGNAVDQWTGCAQHRFDAATAARVQVPSAGRWVARVWLRDAAGNASRATADAVGLALDDVAPEVAFRPIDPSDPTRIDVQATDGTSGLAITEIEVQRRGTSTWTSLPTERTAAGFSARLDDEHLQDGTYDFRARASDAAGNERSTGAAAHRAVPIRITTRLVAGRVTHVKRPRGKRRRVVEVRPTVPYGKTVPIDGRLTMAGGNPVRDAQVEVWEQPALAGATPRRAALVTTDARGRFRYKALRGPSRTLRFRYPGTGLVRARTTVVTVGVKGATSLRTSRRHVVNGEDIALSGRLPGRPLPASGKLIQLQAYTRGGWITFATPRADAKSGRWSHRYRFTSTRGTVRYRFRARVPAESAYPYATGASRSVYVRVRGL